MTYNLFLLLFYFLNLLTQIHKGKKELNKY